VVGRRREGNFDPQMVNEIVGAAGVFESTTWPMTRCHAVDIAQVIG